MTPEFAKSRAGNHPGVIIPSDNNARPHSLRSPAHRGDGQAQGGTHVSRRVGPGTSWDALSMVAVNGAEVDFERDASRDLFPKCADSLQPEGAHPASTIDNFREDRSGVQGDPRSIILALYDEYRPRLFRYMRSMHLGQDQADEVIQETFVRLTTELLKQCRIDNLQGWIVRVSHNLAIDLLKKQQGPLVSSENAAFLIGNRIDPALNPEDAYAQKEQSRRVTNALSTLNPQHRQCFQMRAQGLRYRDIGLALGISEQRAAFVVKQVAVRLAAICG